MTRKWYDDRVGVIEALEALKVIAKAHGVKVVVRRNLAGATWNPSKRVISLGAVCFQSQRYLLSYFFHELAHSVNHDQKKYWTYHKIDKINDQNLKRIALKAERYTDRVGKSLLEIHFPGVPYVEIYDTNEAKKQLYKIFGWT